MEICSLLVLWREHRFFREILAGEGFLALSRDDAAVDLFLMERDPNGVAVQLTEWISPMTG